MENRNLCILASSLGLLALASPSWADDTTSGYSGLESMDAPAIEQKLQINPGFTYTPAADFNQDNLGDVSVWRLDLPARYTITMEEGEIALGAFYEYSEYDFSDLGGIGTQDFNTLAFNAAWKSMINDKWGYFVYGGFGWSASTEASFDDGFTGVGAAGGRYVCSSNLNFGFGLGVASQLEDDPVVLPVIIVNWQINDDWALRVLNGATISYDISGEKRIILDAGLKYQMRQYRLEDDAAVTERMIMAEFGATYRFSPMFALRGFVGVCAGRTFEVRQDGDRLANKDVEAAPYFGVRALVTF
jgi:hypothetical protein